jgi:CheY-like chemotaxis protein
MSEPAIELRILCVDDEPRILDGMRRTLGMNFEVTTALSGAEALERLARAERFAVTISDMRMPGMDGAAYLEKAASIDPDMVRMLLTGQSDMAAAIRAINQGRIFRFLTKPCDADVLQGAVEDALDQHRLLKAERELLQKTVYGCIKVLTEMLSLVNPIAFNHAGRINRLTAQLAAAVKFPEPWQLELAVNLAHLGYVGVSSELLEKAYAGKPLSADDKSLLSSAPRTALGLLGGIPRLEAVMGIIEKLGESPGTLDGATMETPEGRLLWAAHMILAAERADMLSHSQPVARAIADILKAERFNPIIVEALARAKLELLSERKLVKVTARELEPGMFLVEDASSKAGVLMAKGGQQVTVTIAVLLKRMAERNNLQEPMLVSVPA